MSQQRRFELMDEAFEQLPQVGAFIKNAPRGVSMISGWEWLAYGFSQAFDVMWDAAQRDTSGLLLKPLLMLWRQSVELSIKAALAEIRCSPDVTAGHDLSALFDEFRMALAELGYSHDDELSLKVHSMLTEVQDLDRYADRFRYPATRDGSEFEPLTADLDLLYQAHVIVVTYCEGSVIEVSEKRQAAYEMGRAS